MSHYINIADAVAKPSASPEFVVIIVRGTADFDAWLERALDSIESAERLVDFSSINLAEGPQREDGMHTVMAFVTIPVRNSGIIQSIVRTIIQGVMALRLPVYFKHQGSLLYDVDVVPEEVEEYDPTAEHVLWIIGHGVSSIEEWAEGFGHSLNPREEPGVIRAIYVRGADRPDGTQTVLVARVFRKDVLDRKLEEWKDLVVPPFVGNDEAIRSGRVIPPFEPNIRGRVGYQFRWNDNKNLFQTPGSVVASDEPEQGVCEELRDSLHTEKNDRPMQSGSRREGKNEEN